MKVSIKYRQSSNLKEGRNAGNHQEMGKQLGRPVAKRYSLDELLSKCKPETMVLDNEDRKWLNDAPKGRELLLLELFNG